ncbi:hypothetical protein BLNAU_11668 [Blattamonas nauphoetae]|uniref:Uncharacterized protein n=1 Tax=Blattamonas nauphoetae TaxID=2049346 RepID=A0ABQ9XRI7_9EUKA|nr:hypothetical protein BLNAU_11668 [Blattamonas nauphoetae]
MEWFVEVVLVLDNRLKQWPSAPPLNSDDVQIDENRVTCIHPPPSTISTPRENAFSSDSGDIVLPTTSSTIPQVNIPSALYELQAETHNESRGMSHEAIGRTFAGLVDRLSQAGQWIVPEHSLFRQKDVEHSTRLVDVVKGVLKRYSKEKVREEFDSFEGWKGLMRKIVASEETVCDISFLRNWIFRPTLTSLLSKHQHLMSLRPPSLPLPSARLASSLTDHSLTSSESNQPPFTVDTSPDWKPPASFDCDFDLQRGSSSSLTLSQTDTDPSSSSLSLEAQPPPSQNTQSSSSPARSDTGWMISTLHSLISAPLLQSSSHRSRDYPTFSDIGLTVTVPSDINEKFSVSLFDEEDEDIIINSLSRCFYVSAKHRNLSHIDDPLAFVDRLVGALGSSNARLQEFTRTLLNDPTIRFAIPPPLYLNHTSLNPKYRRSVFPIDLLFERQARSDANAFLRTNTVIIAQDSSQFLHTPLFVFFATPFGDCLSLKWLFQNLSPLNPNDEREKTYLRDCRDVVITLHWLNIPSHFDSPLLAHLPSLISSHPPSLRPSLLREYGIHTLMADPNTPSFLALFDSTISNINSDSRTAYVASLVIRLSASGHPLPVPLLDRCRSMLCQLINPFPAVVSVTLEMFHRLVLTCSDEAKMKLVKHGLLDVVMVAVSRSSFLSDYESGIVVIGELVESIHRVCLQKWIVGMDFSSLLTRW